MKPHCIVSSLLSVAVLVNLTPALRGGEVVLQPGPQNGKDIWTTSTYSYAPGGSFPGGGKDDFELVVGGWGDLYYSLLQFDLSAMPKTANSAHLELFCFQPRGTGTTPLYLDRITEFWDWKTQGTGRDYDRLWWDDRPATTPWLASPLAAPIVGQWYSIEMTDLYNGWQSGLFPNFGIELRPLFNNNQWAEFYSSDYDGDISFRPRLLVTTAQSLTLAEQAAELAKTVVGGNYELGAKGWDWKTSTFVESAAIQSTGYHWNPDNLLLLDHALDCSGLSFWAFNKSFGATKYIDYKTPNPVHYEGADGQYKYNTTKVNEQDLKPGDLLFFNHDVDADPTRPFIDHVAMYVGCCSPDGNDVVQAEINHGIIWSKRSDIVKSITGFVGYGRVSTPQIGVAISTHSPVDLVVTDPDGFTIRPETHFATGEESLREIPDVWYYSISLIDSDALPETVITSPVLKNGAYYVIPVPRPDANQDSTFGLDAVVGGNPLIFAKDAPLSSIPVLGYGFSVSGTTVTPFLPVTIEVKPGSAKSPLNLKSKGVTPVAIYSAKQFNVAALDKNALSFGAGALIGAKSQLVDLNGDGTADLLLQVPTQQIKVQSGEVVVFTGRTLTGVDVRGEAHVTVVP